MNWFTTVELPQKKVSISVSDKTEMLGTCFAEHVGGKLLESGIDCEVNPFGVLYNPKSIELLLSLALESEEAPSLCKALQASLFESGGRWQSWLCSTRFSAESRDELLQQLHTLFHAFVCRLKNLDVLFLTFGTNRYYRHTPSGMVVSNCHKQPARLFAEEDLSKEEIVSSYSLLFTQLLRLRPSLRVVFTVSPYRYVKYGLHSSQLSKAVLLLAVNELEKLFPEQVSYFPAYELMLDELRDYRFYADDMLHPSSVAVDYIWERFRAHLFTKESDALASACAEIKRGLAHRPLNPASDAYQDFLQALHAKTVRLQAQYASSFLTESLHTLTNRINDDLHAN